MTSKSSIRSYVTGRVVKGKLIINYSLLLKLSCGTLVQAQAATYFKNKNIQQNSQGSYVPVEAKSSGSTLFRDGIKRRHRRQLDEYRHLKLSGITDGNMQNILVGQYAK